MSCDGTGVRDAPGITNQDPKYDRSRPLCRLELAFKYPLVNCPGKSAVGLLVHFPPNAATPPHRHGGASGIGYVIEGSVLNKMNNDPIKIVDANQSWYEAPGCHHKISENASTTEPAKLLATLVVDTKVVEEGGLNALVVLDEEYSDIQF